jgi:hypothetical protein
MDKEFWDLVGRIMATIMLSAAAIGGVWALVEFGVFMMQWKRGRRKRKK